MSALDTNLIVRFLVEDDAAQSALVAALIDAAAVAEERLFVGEVVLCEVAWVLARAYRFGKAEIAGALRSLLHARQIAVRDSAALHRALDAFADYVIREQARAAGAAPVVTFDRALHGEADFVAP